MSYTRAKALKDATVRRYAAHLGVDGRYHEEGRFKTEKETAKKAAQLELDASRGDWASPIAGRTTLADYVSASYWPTTQHREVSTRTAYGYDLDKHFLPRFGTLPMRRISPAMVQAWVNDVTAGSLSPRSVVKYHALLHKIFNRAVIDRAIGLNPAIHTALPKVVAKPKQIITAAQFEDILVQLLARCRMMVLLAIETGLCWGELIALRPCDIDMTTHVVLVRPFHNLRAAHASWLLAGGAVIIIVQKRLGHRRITTTQQYTGTLPDAGDRALTAYRKIRYGRKTNE